MLLEALNFATTFVVSPRKDAREINSSVTLWARARRCARDWAEHEANSKAFVLKSIETLRQRRVVAVLGSGLLRDVPIEALSKQFDEVRLFDLQHLASIRLWAAMKGLRNLRFENRDLSGYEQLQNDPASAPKPLAFLADIPDLDLVISANLLSQIGVGIGRLMQTGKTALLDDAVPRLIAAHVQDLSALTARTCLITDTSYEVIDKRGQVLERDDLMRGVTLPAPQTTWTWPVAPFGELDPTYQAVHRVVGITPPQAGPGRSLP
jgi:hypothetical protein